MKTAVILHDTNISDLNYHVMSELNTFSKDNEVFLLTNNISSKVIDPFFAIMSTSKLSYVYDGIVIATSLDTVRTLIKSAINSHKVWFMYSLEWLYTVFDYEELYNIINNPNLTIIVRSHSHKNLLENVFNRQSHIVSDFRLDEIWNMLDAIKNA